MKILWGTENQKMNRQREIDKATRFVRAATRNVHRIREIRDDSPTLQERNYWQRQLDFAKEKLRDLSQQAETLLYAPEAPFRDSGG